VKRRLLEQSKVVGIFRLQRSDQEFELGKAAQTGEARIFQEKRPACESRADASLEPVKSSFAPSRERESASDLIIGVVCVPKRLRTGTGLGHASDCCFSVPGQGVE
jgi:hypothetical protein